MRRSARSPRKTAPRPDAAISTRFLAHRAGRFHHRYPVAAKLSPFPCRAGRDTARRGSRRQNRGLCARALSAAIEARPALFHRGRPASRRRGVGTLFWRLRNEPRGGAAAGRCGSKCMSTTAAPSPATKSRATGCSAGIAIIMTITATRCVSKSRSARNRKAGRRCAPADRPDFAPRIGFDGGHRGTRRRQSF